MAFAEDEHPVSDLRPDGEYEPFRISVIQVGGRGRPERVHHVRGTACRCAPSGGVIRDSPGADRVVLRLAGGPGCRLVPVLGPGIDALQYFLTACRLDDDRAKNTLR